MAGGRLAKDVQYLQRHIDSQTNGQVKVIDVDDNLKYLLLHFMPNDGFYKGAKLKFKVFFPECYPEEVPRVLCQDQVYHPNIDTSQEYEEEPPSEEDLSSNVCVSLLDEWEPDMGLDHVVMALLFLLHNPNVDDALSPYFDPTMDQGELEDNIRRTLRGETLDGVAWPRLLVDDADGDAAEGGEGAAKGGGEEVTETTSNTEQDNDGDRLNTNDTAIATENFDTTVSAQSADSEAAVETERPDQPDVSNTTDSNSDNNISESPLDPAALNHQNLALSTDVVVPRIKDSPVIFAGCDCKNCDTDTANCLADSLGIRRLFSCTGCRVSGIKALFSCFHHRGVKVEFPASTTSVCEFGDCDVD